MIFQTKIEIKKRTIKKINCTLESQMVEAWVVFNMNFPIVLWFNTQMYDHCKTIYINILNELMMST